MSHPPRTWNEGFEDEAERRRNRRDDEQRWERERDPQRFGRQSFGRPRRDDDDSDAPGRFSERERWEEDDRGRRAGGYTEQPRYTRESGIGTGGRERWESYEAWQQPRRLSGYYENHRFGGEPGFGRQSERDRERWQPYEGGAQDFQHGFQDWQRRRSFGDTEGQRFGHESPGMGYGQGYGSEDRGFAGRGPKNYKRSDQRIQEDLCERLTSDPRVDASEIQVEVKNGEVTLEGSVSEREMKRRAEDCAEYVSGVSQVHNRLRVAPSQTGREGQSAQPGQSGSETWARAGTEQRADQPGTSLPGRSGRTA